MAVELFRRMQQVPPGKDGIRFSQFAVVRNTLRQLQTTVLPVITSIFGGLCEYSPSKSEVRFKFNDVDSVWLLLPLDTPQNVQRLLSLELTGAWMSECREMPVSLVGDVYSRCGRYPSRMKHGADPDWYGVIAESNSWDEDSDWFAAMLPENMDATWALFVQPPAITNIDYEEGTWDVTGENHENLPGDYYTDLVRSNGGLRSRWVRQYILNEVTESLAGEGVYSNTYIRDFHEFSDLDVVPMSPICVGLDTGRNPAAVIGQVDATGIVRVFDECYMTNCGMEYFMNERLMPLLRSTRFMGHQIYAVVDPAGNQRSQIGEESVTAAINRLGLPAFPASTNAIEPRIRAVESVLARQAGGQAAFRVDGRCTGLIRGFRGGYRYERRKIDGELNDVKPIKSHPTSDIHDALQYFVLGTSSAVRTAIMNRMTPRTATRVSVDAWT
jgi:hypothetical protein